MDCTFCKKSATHLTSHNLCSLCLVHVECCEIDDILTEDGGGSSPPDDDDNDDDEAASDVQMDKMPVQKNVPDSKVECDICLEEIQKSELEQHREMCSPRILFRCSICWEDYLSKEGLWNHLDLHEIEDEDKELNYKEVRTTQKCVLCNDQRGYVEKKYWEHVHEDHDGYFLRCLDCGESFRSKKQHINHTLRNCKAVKEIGGREVISLNLPLQINVLANFSKLYEQAQGNPTNLDIVSFIREKSEKVDINSDVSKVSIETQNCNAQKIHKVSDHKSSGCDTRENSPNCGQGLPLKRKYEEENSFSCGICGETYEDFYNLALHVKQHHYDETNCQKLLDVFKAPEHQNQATNTEDDSQITNSEPTKLPVENCPICGDTMRDRDQLSLHVKENHQMITCSGCGETYIDVGLKNQTPQLPPTPVPMFDRKNANKQPGIKCRCYNTDQGHTRTDHIRHSDDHREQSTDSDPRFQCPCCVEKFQEKKQLQRHMSEHVDEIINKKFQMTSTAKEKEDCSSTADSQHDQTSEIEKTPSLS